MNFAQVMGKHMDAHRSARELFGENAMQQVLTREIILSSNMKS